MSLNKKPIKITLFHADYCGYCTDFMPTWESMKSDNSACENIDFEDYEAGAIAGLQENDRSINGRDVRTFGYPTIKIKVNDKEYMYQGKRTVDNIYESIVGELQKLKEVDSPVTVTKSVGKNDSMINLSSTSADDEDRPRLSKNIPIQKQKENTQSQSQMLGGQGRQK